MNPHDIACAFHDVAQSNLMNGQIKDAEKHFHQAVDQYRRTSDEYSLAFCLFQCALVLRAQSKREAAEDMLVESISLIKKVGIKREDIERVYLNCYIQNLREIYNARAEDKLLRRRLRQAGI